MLSNKFIEEIKNSFLEFLNDNPSNDEISAKKIRITKQIKGEYSRVADEAEKKEFAPILEEIEEIKNKFKLDSAKVREEFTSKKQKGKDFLSELAERLGDAGVSPKDREKTRDNELAARKERDSKLKELSEKRDKDIEELNKKLEDLRQGIPQLDNKTLNQLKVLIFGDVKKDELQELIEKVKIQRDGEDYPNKTFLSLNPDSLDKYDFTFTNVESVDISQLKEMKKTSEKKAHIQLIIDTIKKREKISTKKFTGFGIDSDELIAGFNLTKSNEREAIYKFWENISEKEEEFTDALDSFIDELKNLPKEIKSKEIESFIQKYENKSEDLFYLSEFPSQLKRIPEPLGILINIIAFKERFYEEVEVSFEENNSDELQDFISDFAAYIPSDERGGGGGTKASFDVYKPNLLEEINSDLTGELKNIEEDLDKIDPLLLYDMVVNKTIALVKREISEFNEELDEFIDSDSFDYISGVLADASVMKTILPQDDYEELQDLVDALEDTFAIEGDSFTLPVFMLYDEKFEKAYERKEIEFERKIKIKNPKEIDDKIQEFLKDVTSLVDIDFQFAIKEGKAAEPTLGYEPDRTITSWARDRDKVTIDRLEQSQVSTLRGKKVETRIEEDLKKIMTPFLTAISEYYYKPFFRNRDIGIKPKYLSNNTGRGIVLLANELNVDTILGSSYKKLLRGTQSQRRQLRPKLFKDILTFLQLTRNPSNLEQLIDVGESAVQGLTKIFPKTEERNRNHIAKIISSLADKMKTKDTVDRKKIKGKTIKQRAVEYDKQVSQGLEMPLFALPYWITVNKRSFNKQTHQRVFAKLENFFNRGQNVPLVLTKMLLAHDEIRKMLGKDVVYGFYNLEYNDIDEFILKIHDKNKLDLSHMEVTEIVKSYDSHENISKEYGISSDEVYLIKANFR